MTSLKVRDVAARLNVSEKTVYKWLAQGFIPATRLGRTWVISEEALETVLATPTSGNAATAGHAAQAPAAMNTYPGRPLKPPELRRRKSSTPWAG